MTVPFHHLDAGRSEVRWLSDGRWNESSRLRMDAGGGIRRLVVLAAHPDDETLGAGGLMRASAAADIPVDVVIATDGEASHPDSPTHTPADLARLRRAEVAAAVAVLAPRAAVRYLGLRDGGLASEVDRLTAAIREHVGDLGVGAILVAPWRDDGHVDHDTVGAAAAQVARETGALLLEYPIWAWHWGERDDLPWSQLRVLPLDDETLAAKRRALATHVTQVAPLSDAPGDEVLLSPRMRTHFDRSFETFVDASGHAHEGIFERLHAVEDDPWQVRDSDYERRKRKLTLEMLPHERFSRGYEPGCSIGELSAALAARCDALVCQDVSETAVRQARARLAAYPQVQVRRGAVPADWPDGDFDLVMLSEIGYFLSATELDEMLRRTRMTLRPDGYVVLCHWAHPIDGWELDGAYVHARAAELLGLPVHQRLADPDALMEVFGPCP